VTSPTLNFPFHQPWSLGWVSMQYGRILTWACNRISQVLIKFKVHLVW
jgi:hypothetical protein